MSSTIHARIPNGDGVHFWEFDLADKNESVAVNRQTYKKVDELTFVALGKPTTRDDLSVSRSRDRLFSLKAGDTVELCVNYGAEDKYEIATIKNIVCQTFQPNFGRVFLQIGKWADFPDLVDQNLYSISAVNRKI